jgi:hypothetical protein
MFGLAHFDPVSPPPRISDAAYPDEPSSLPSTLTQSTQRGVDVDKHKQSVENSTNAREIDHRPRRAPNWSAHQLPASAPLDQQADLVQHAGDDIEAPGALPLDEYIWRDMPIEDTELWRQAEQEPFDALAEPYDAGLARRWVDQGGAPTEKID